MPAVDLTAASNYLKNRFHPQAIENLSYGASPLFAMLPKKTDFGSNDLKVPVSYADIKGRSCTFSVAQSNKQGDDTEAFLVTTKKDYALFSIQGQVIKQSQGDLNAWLPALEKNAKSAVRALSRSTSWAVYRDSIGLLGQVSDVTDGSNITLVERADVQHWEKGMTLEMVNSSNTAEKRSGKLKISSIERNNGKLIMNADVDTAITGATNSDYLVPEGDFNQRITGLAGWIATDDANTSTNIFGVNAQLDAVRLGGVKYNAQGQNILESILNASAISGENGAEPDKLFVNFDKWRELMNYLGSSVVYTRGSSFGSPNADVGFQGIRIHGPSSVIDVYADRHCQPKTGWLLQMDTWCLHSSGGCPMLLEEDGQSILREATDDAYEGRWGAYYQMYTDAPGLNCRIRNL